MLIITSNKFSKYSSSDTEVLDEALEKVIRIENDLVGRQQLDALRAELEKLEHEFGSRKSKLRSELLVASIGVAAGVLGSGAALLPPAIPAIFGSAVVSILAGAFCYSSYSKQKRVSFHLEVMEKFYSTRGELLETDANRLKSIISTNLSKEVEKQ